jgi:hypothetical protein
MTRGEQRQIRGTRLAERSKHIHGGLYHNKITSATMGALHVKDTMFRACVVNDQPDAWCVCGSLNQSQ